MTKLIFRTLGLYGSNLKDSTTEKEEKIPSGKVGCVLLFTMFLLLLWSVLVNLFYKINVGRWLLQLKVHIFYVYIG